ncbi:G- coupled receptor Mth2 [Paramuricea clavata]|uniref:G- coupled receptor Mth2 n=1 Tax=Paramuricea clavata TaxID=317549 RepID=A0A7D9I6P8_PARCT|nr:G- coupled receptor Mth2 [Paramuricea clavata]
MQRQRKNPYTAAALLANEKRKNGAFCLKQHAHKDSPGVRDQKTRKTLAQQSARFHHERQRRQSREQPSGKCSSQRYCTGNETIFRDKNENYCSCDEACFNIFSDCCPDYERHCGLQEKLEPEQPASMWKCVEFSWSPTWPCKIEGVTGVWMIYKCPEHRTFDELRTKCENGPSEFSYPIEDFIPVVGVNGETFRNKYCALCNGVENYTMWNVGVFTYVIPPEEFDLDMKLKFIENNGGTIEHVSPRGEQPRRFCFGRNYLDNCSSADPRLYKACVEGPIEVVTTTRNKYLYFKNFACALCNVHRDAVEWKTAQVCSPILPEGFSAVFNLEGKKTTTNVVRKFCPSGTVYDPTLKFCRKGYIITSSGELTNEFLILLWFKQSKARSVTEINSKLENVFNLALSSHFSILSNQISRMTFQQQDERNALLVVSFRLTLTPFQTLIMANQNKTSLNATHENTAFLLLLDSKGNLTLFWKNFTFVVVKVISERLSCYGEEKLQSNEYEINRENGTLVVNRTGQVFLLQDYTLFEENGGNITLCLKLVLSNCEGAYVPLSPDEYEIFPI